MPISLAVPLQRAWGRMERMLFRPFRLRTWFVLGFAAFLSEYGALPSSGGASTATRPGTAPARGRPGCSGTR